MMNECLQEHGSPMHGDVRLLLLRWGNAFGAFGCRVDLNAFIIGTDVFLHPCTISWKFSPLHLMPPKLAAESIKSQMGTPVFNRS